MFTFAPGGTNGPRFAYYSNGWFLGVSTIVSQLISVVSVYSIVFFG